MSQKLLNSYQQFSDLNGNPLAGGSLVFSETGTDTPKTVYAAEGQTSSLGSTVTLDSAGRPSSGGSVTEVYSAATGAYRITVKDSAGVNVVVTENVSALLEFSALTMTGQLKLDDSTSTSAPPLTFDGDTDTGLSRPAADILAWITGGIERLRATTTGITFSLPVAGALRNNSSTNTQGVVGFVTGTADASVNSVRVADVADSATEGLRIGGRFVGTVNVVIVNAGNASFRTNRQYFVSAFDAETATITQLATSNGSGGPVTFTIAYNATTDEIEVTNTDGGPRTISIAAFGMQGL